MQCSHRVLVKIWMRPFNFAKNMPKIWIKIWMLFLGNFCEIQASLTQLLPKKQKKLDDHRCPGFLFKEKVFSVSLRSYLAASYVS